MRTTALTLLAGLAALVSLTGCAPSRGSATEAPDCPVARVGDDVVTVADAEVVRAAVQPPLTRGEARRLAVSATAAYRLQHPDGPMAGIGARLHAHRQAVHDRSDLDSVAVAPGACWAAEGLAAPVSN